MAQTKASGNGPCVEAFESLDRIERRVPTGSAVFQSPVASECWAAPPAVACPITRCPNKRYRGENSVAVFSSLSAVELPPIRAASGPVPFHWASSITTPPSKSIVSTRYALAVASGASDGVTLAGDSNTGANCRIMVSAVISEPRSARGPGGLTVGRRDSGGRRVGVVVAGGLAKPINPAEPTESSVWRLRSLGAGSVAETRAILPRGVATRSSCVAAVTPGVGK